MNEQVIPRYARNGDVRIAYHVIGEASLDLVFVAGFNSNIELAWENPVIAHSRRRLASFARAVYFDKRGTGLSDRDAGIPSLDERVDDLVAVMDAASMTSAAFVGSSEGGPMSMLFSAVYPERVTALVLWDSFACLLRNEQQPWALDKASYDLFLAFVGERWGTGEVYRMMAPSSSDDAVDWFGRYERLGASPSAALALVELAGSIDVRWLLDSISVPTLVLHRMGNTIVPVEHARMLAGRIRDAKLIELPGSDHVPTEFEDDALDCIEEFLTGTSASRSANRVLATVLFSDIVSSTETLARHGDSRWRAILDAQEDASRRIVSRHRGRTVKSTGDGSLAVFPTPGLAISAATDLHRAARAMGVTLRLGIHTGEVEVRGDDIAGMSVHIAARAMAKAAPAETLVTRTVTELLAGSRQGFEPKGEHELKGVPGNWALFAVSPSK